MNQEFIFFLASLLLYYYSATAKDDRDLALLPLFPDFSPPYRKLEEETLVRKAEAEDAKAQAEALERASRLGDGSRASKTMRYRCRHPR